MAKQTNNYALFKFRDDNRKEISTSHVEKLIRSIEMNNLLNLRPITVNGQMEVIDGQHRLLAAKNLNIPIWYEVREDLTQKDLITLNVSRSWKKLDFLNFYVKNGYQEYIKLDNFLKKNNIPISAAIRINGGGKKKVGRDFIEGNFIFAKDADECMENINEILDLIKYLKTNTSYLTGMRVYLSLFRVSTHENYCHEKFRENIKRLIEKIEPKATQEGYIKMFVDIHNWRNAKRIAWQEDIDTEINLS